MIRQGAEGTALLPDGFLSIHVPQGRQLDLMDLGMQGMALTQKYARFLHKKLGDITKYWELVLAPVCNEKHFFLYVTLNRIHFNI